MIEIIEINALLAKIPKKKPMPQSDISVKFHWNLGLKGKDSHVFF